MKITASVLYRHSVELEVPDGYNIHEDPDDLIWEAYDNHMSQELKDLTDGTLEWVQSEIDDENGNEIAMWN